MYVLEHFLIWNIDTSAWLFWHMLSDNNINCLVSFFKGFDVAHATIYRTCNVIVDLAQRKCANIYIKKMMYFLLSTSPPKGGTLTGVSQNISKSTHSTSWLAALLLWPSACCSGSHSGKASPFPVCKHTLPHPLWVLLWINSTWEQLRYCSKAPFSAWMLSVKSFPAIPKDYGTALYYVMEKRRGVFCSLVLKCQRCFSTDIVRWVSIVTLGHEVCYWPDQQKIRTTALKRIQI